MVTSIDWTGQGVFQLSTTLGTVTAPTDVFTDGRLPVELTAGTTLGVAEITWLIDSEPPLYFTFWKVISYEKWSAWMGHSHLMSMVGQAPYS